jgi:hypothetical protein
LGVGCGGGRRRELLAPGGGSRPRSGPTPTKRRLLERRSGVAGGLANGTGWRAEAIKTVMPSRTRAVRALTKARVAMAS